MVPLLKHTLTCIFLFVPLTLAQECDRIGFKKQVHLPKECVHSSVCGPRTTFIPRSPGANTARRLVGWEEYLPGCDGRVWGNFSATVESTHSFKSERIAQYLFGSNCLHFSGSQVRTRGPRDILADYVGLPTTFQGTVCFKPTIKNVVLDFTFHLGLDDWLEGLYFKSYFPVVHTTWDLGVHCNEVNNVPLGGVIPTFPPCYMSKQATNAVQTIRDALRGDTTFGDMKVFTLLGETSCSKVRDTGVADIQVILGWNHNLSCSSHAGFYFTTVIPTSNKPDGSLVFQPIIGNGDLWEVGSGFSGHCEFLRRDYHSASLWFDGYITYQFKKFQVRSFDFVGHGPLSRYLLLKEFNGQDIYENSLISGLDFATRAAYVGGTYKIDASVKLSYTYSKWGFDAGYNIYARGKEQLCIDTNLFPSDFNNRRFGIKGTEGVCYRVFNTITNTLTNKTGVLNATQSNATITQPGTVDNPTRITNLEPGEIAITWDSPLEANSLKEAFNSNPPVRILPRDLDINTGAIPPQLTHKFFAHVSYVALDTCWEPQIGVGGEIEFDGKSKFLSSLNQWGVWIKAGLSF